MNAPFLLPGNMSNIVTPGQVNQPRIVSLAELQEVLLPLCFGDKWAESTIVDLWKLGAPVPVAPGDPEKRILLPNQFKKWFADFSQRVGFSVTPDGAYNQAGKLLPTSAGSMPKQRRR